MQPGFRVSCHCGDERTRCPCAPARRRSRGLTWLRPGAGALHLGSDCTRRVRGAPYAVDGLAAPPRVPGVEDEGRRRSTRAPRGPRGTRRHGTQSADVGSAHLAQALRHRFGAEWLAQFGCQVGGTNGANRVESLARDGWRDPAPTRKHPRLGARLSRAEPCETTWVTSAPGPKSERRTKRTSRRSMKGTSYVIRRSHRSSAGFREHVLRYSPASRLVEDSRPCLVTSTPCST